MGVWLSIFICEMLFIILNSCKFWRHEFYLKLWSDQIVWISYHIQFDFVHGPIEIYVVTKNDFSCLSLSCMTCRSTFFCACKFKGKKNKFVFANSSFMRTWNSVTIAWSDLRHCKQLWRCRTYFTQNLIRINFD